MRQKLLRFAIAVTAAVVAVIAMAMLILVTARDQLTANIVVSAARLTDADIVLRVSDHEGTRDLIAAGSGIEQDVEMGPTTRFRIGSITKTFGATVVMQLVDEGRIELDGPIAGQLPEPIPGGDRITDEDEQVRYHDELLEIFEEEGVDTALWFTFGGYNRPGERDLGSYGVVRILDENHWEPKKVFHAMTARYRQDRQPASEKTG
ncbi:serine hydrolase [Nocardia flavorosea]|uniref:Beta-lactamase family protein n=1 Tax=Nocardia flavorosea TaxID=53429 RepID=A0A846YPF4_9NOCA|nr:serine hydrolase domain-containing protein [Nocardia flavorosea]NKY61005.1 beta-lactamase family protein [Nocardia flavorosea]